MTADAKILRKTVGRRTQERIERTIHQDQAGLALRMRGSVGDLVTQFFIWTPLGRKKN